MKSLVEFSIRNTLLINLLFIFIIIAGAITIFQIQREAHPNISFDIVVISTYYPGATPEEVEKLITIPIEKELKQVDEIKEISSVSADGISNIIVKMEENADNKDKVINDIQRAVDRVDDFPSNLRDKPFVKDIKTKDRPVIEISLSGNMDEWELRKHAKALEKRIADLPSVSRVDMMGYRNEEIWVEVDQKTLEEQHLNIESISQAIAQQNQAIPGGKYYLDGKEYSLRTTGEYDNHQDIKKTIVRASSLGKWIQVQDIANVFPSFEEETIINKSKGTRSINLTVVKKSTGDTITLVDQTKHIVDEYKLTAGSGLNTSYINDLAYYIKRRQNVLINNGFWGMILVIVIMFTFLSARTAVAACLGILTAISLTFTLMHFLNVSFNLISMFGLIMVMGMLVDEDIVISENIYRHIELDKSPEDATVKGVVEVAKPLFVTVLTTVAAFVPILMMGGIMGKFTRSIPIVVTITLIASLFQAVCILPSHLYHLNKGLFKIKRAKVKKTNTFFHRLIQKYKRIMLHCLHYRYLYSLGMLILFISIVSFAVLKMKFILFPSDAIEEFYVKVELPEGNTLLNTSNKISEIEEIVSTIPKEELDAFTTTVGIVQQDANDPETIRTSYVGQITIFLTPEVKRTRKTQEIIEDLRTKVKNLKGFVRIDFDMVRMGPPVGKPIQIRISGDDFHTLQNISQNFKDELSTIDGVTDVKDDYKINKDEIKITIDPIKAAQTDLTVEQIALTIRNAFDGKVATTIKTSEEEIDVLVKLADKLKYDKNTLNNLLIPNKNNQLIRLDHLATFEKTKGVMAIQHFDGIRTINVTSNIDENITSPLAVSQHLEPLYNKTLREHPNYTLNFGGEVQETSESLMNLFTAFYLAAALILLILVASFRSLLQPMAIMMTIPFSIIGVIIAFNIHQKPLSFLAILGMIGLTGVVVDSGIIMIDFANQLKKQGYEIHEAIIEGAATRLRAVVLTSLTTFVGIAPAAYGIGGSDPFIKPMALALSYGLLFGAALTIFYIPIFLAIAEDIRSFIRRIMTRIWTEYPEHEST